MRKVLITSVLQGFEQKTSFFEACFWFKFNSLGLALGVVFKFYTSVAKLLKIKVRKILGLIPTFEEVKGKKLVGGCLFGSPFLSGVKKFKKIHFPKYFQLERSRTKHALQNMDRRRIEFVKTIKFWHYLNLTLKIQQF